MEPAFDENKASVVFASDASYAPHLYTAVESLLHNLSPSWNADIIVLVDRPFDPALQETFARLLAHYPNASLRWLEIPAPVAREIGELRVNPLYSAATYYRLFLTRILPRCGRVVYCDVDVVIPGDISELFTIDMGEYSLGACFDLSLAIDDDRNPSCRYATETLGLRRASSYFNAGVLLMDLDRMRSDGWEERLAMRVGRVSNYRYLDQDLLNLVFEDAWYPLPFRWNFFYVLLANHRLYTDEQKRRFEACVKEKSWGIIHFTGTNPWSTAPLLDRNEAYFEWETYALRNPLLEWDAMLRAVNRMRRALRVNLFWRYCRLLALPTQARRARYEHKHRQYIGLVRDARLLKSHTAGGRTPGVLQQRDPARQTSRAISAYLDLRGCVRHPASVLPRLPGKLLRLLRRLTVWKRTPATCPRYLCVAACLKNEAPYLEEWLEYHLLMGVEHFYLYDNDSSDDPASVLEPYIRQGLVTCTAWPGKGQQHAIYRHALGRLAGETRWLAFLDIDEFAQPLRHPDLPSLLHTYEDAVQLVAQWVHFGSSGRETRTPGLVVERFTRREPGSTYVGKSFFRPAAAIDTQIHFCFVFGKSVDEDGQPLEGFTPTKNTSTSIRINHYATKSREEYLAKVQKGTSVGGAVASDYFERLDRNECEDTSMAAFAETLRRRIAQRRS